MSGIPFHNTVMGHRFIESTVPALVRELHRLNDHLDQLTPILKTMAESKAPNPEPREKPR